MCRIGHNAEERSERHTGLAGRQHLNGCCVFAAFPEIKAINLGVQGAEPLRFL